MSGDECPFPPAGWRCTRGRHLSQEPCAAVLDRRLPLRMRVLTWLLAKCGSRYDQGLLEYMRQDARAKDRWFV